MAISRPIAAVSQPRWRWGELLTTLMLGFAILLLWRVPYAQMLVYPFRLFATYVHELGHGLTALATGGGFEHFVVRTDLSGTAWSAGGIRWMVISAGYVGCALFGNLLILLSAKGMSGRVVLGALGLMLAIGCLLFVRNGFGMLCGAILSGALILASLRLRARWCDGLLLLLAVQLVIDGLNSLIDLISLAGDPSIFTDARSMSVLTGLPATLWAVLWSAISVAALLYTLRLAYRRGADD